MIKIFILILQNLTQKIFNFQEYKSTGKEDFQQYKTRSIMNPKTIQFFKKEKTIFTVMAIMFLLFELIKKMKWKDFL